MTRSHHGVWIFVSLAAVAAVVACGSGAVPRPVGLGLRALQAAGREAAKADGDRNVDDTTVSGLRKAVERFIEAADKGDAEAIAAVYDPEFTCVRVADEGGFVKLSREQMLGFFRRAGASGAGAGGHAIPTKIHHVEMIGEAGYVLLTRTKDLGKGFEPMFYSLVWRKQGDGWHLLREFVHQRSIPKFQ